MNLSKSHHSRFCNRRRSPTSNNSSTNTTSFVMQVVSILITATLINSDIFTRSFSIDSITIRQDHGKYHRNYHNRVFPNTNPSTIPMTAATQSKTTIRQMTASTNQNLGAPICVYHQVDVRSSEKNPVPRQAISVEDLTPTLQTLLEESGMTNGLLTVISRHTTTSLTINEWESRLADDIAESLLKLIPPDERSISPASQKDVTYTHNDIHLRPFGDNEEDNHNVDSEEAQRCRENGWDVDDPVQLQAWRDQEPINAHSHLLSILAGSGSESIPVVDGKMVLGQWQSVLLLDLDGPRDRTVGVQLMGYS